MKPLKFKDFGKEEQELVKKECEKRDIFYVDSLFFFNCDNITSGRIRYIRRT